MSRYLASRNSENGSDRVFYVFFDWAKYSKPSESTLDYEDCNVGENIVTNMEKKL